MRIAFISIVGAPYWGGSEYLWVAAAEEGLEAGHQVAFSTVRPAALPKQLVDLLSHGANANWRMLPGRRDVAGRALNQVVRHNGVDWLRQFRPDVICVSQGATYDAALYPRLRRYLQGCGLPYVLICQWNSDHPLSTDRDRSDARGLMCRAAAIAFVSDANRRAAERQLACALPLALVMRNPVNLADLTPLAWPGSTAAEFASVARLEVAYKGQDVLFEALSSPNWRQREWHLRLYGVGADEGYLKALAAHYDIGGRVEFCGYVGDIRSVWGENRMLVLASRSEGTPLALVEAMVCGRPSVVTDVGGNAEWIEESETGFVAPAPTAGALSAALERAWAARSRWNVIGDAARARALLQVDMSPGRTLLDLIAAAAQATPRLREST